MLYIICKVLLTATFIVLISEIAKINDRLGGLVAAMPLTTFFVLFWFYFDNVSINKISNHMTYTLIYLLPTIPMFILFPVLIKKFGFHITVLISFVLTLLLVFIVDFFSKQFQIKF